jgi:hypothetical protein
MAAAEAPEPLPPKVMAFWNFDEDARPWDKGSGEIWGGDNSYYCFPLSM